MKNKFYPKISAVISGALTAAICAVMNLIFIPGIEAETQGIKCFDMNFGYTFDTAVRFLELLGENGRDIYLHRQLPLDFVYPVAYTVFFISVLSLLTGRRFPRIAILPALLALCDYAENYFIIYMLGAGTLSPAAVRAASCFTMAKTVLMYATGAVILCLIVRKIIIKAKGKKEQV
jgi:glucan phosphoethanolaminetransferase (alkaline phosphatase superfamily)